MWEPQTFNDAANKDDADEVSASNWTKDSLRQWDASVNIAAGRELQPYREAQAPYTHLQQQQSIARQLSSKAPSHLSSAKDGQLRDPQPHQHHQQRQQRETLSPNEYSETASPASPLYLASTSGTSGYHAHPFAASDGAARTNSSSLRGHASILSGGFQPGGTPRAATSAASTPPPLGALAASVSRPSVPRTVRVVEPHQDGGSKLPAGYSTSKPLVSALSGGSSTLSSGKVGGVHFGTPRPASRYDQLAQDSSNHQHHNQLTSTGATYSPSPIHHVPSQYADASSLSAVDMGYAEEFSGSESPSRSQRRGTEGAGVRPKLDAASREVGRRYGGGPDARQRATQWILSAEKHEVACYKQHKAQNVYQRHVTTLGANSAMANATAYSDTHPTSSATDIRSAQARKNATRALAHRIDVFGSQPEKLRDQRMRVSEQRQESEEYRWARGKAFTMAPLRPMRDGRFETPGPGEYFIPSEFQGVIRVPNTN